MSIMKRYLYMTLGAAMLCLSSCSGIEGDYDDVIMGLDHVSENLDYILDDTYTDIINDYAANISKYDKGAEAEYWELFNKLDITYPYDYAASGVVSGLFGDFGDVLIAAGDNAIRSKSKSDVEKKIKKNMDIPTLLVYISLVQQEGSIDYCFETSGFNDKNIEFTTKDIKSILADFDYNQLVNSGAEPSGQTESNSSESTGGDYTYANTESASSGSEIARMAGKVGGKYPIEMELDLSDWDNVTGRYRYTSSGSGAWLTLKGNLSEGYLKMTEYNTNGEQCGSWNGDCYKPDGEKLIFSGTMTNSAGKTFNVELSE